MKITPMDNRGAVLINAYGGMGFRIAGERYEGSVIITLSAVVPWPVGAPEDITVEGLAAVFGGDSARPDILLVGCGPHFMILPQEVRDWARGQEIALDSMDTGAAARTYNVLRQEDRSVAVAMIAID